MSYDETRREAYKAAVAVVGQIVSTAEVAPTEVSIRFGSFVERPELNLYFHHDVAGVEAFAKRFGGYCTSEDRGEQVYTSAQGECEGFEFTAWTLEERAA